MPTFTLQAPDGRKVRIEAKDQATAVRGAQEWYASQAPKTKPKPNKGGDILRSGLQGLTEGAAGLADNVRQVMGAPVLNVLQSAANFASGDPTKLPGPDFAATNALAREGYKPQTREGRYARSVGQMAPNALAPGGLPAKAAAVVVPGITAEASREGAEAMGFGKTGQAAAQFAGGMAGGALAAFRPSRAGSEPANLLAKRAKLDADEMQAKAAEMRSAGVEPSLIDVAGPKGRRVLRAVGVKDETAGEVLTKNARSMSSGAKPEIMAETRKVGPMRGTTADELVVSLTQLRDDAAKTNYAEPYNTFVQVPDTVMDMLHDSAGRSIIGRARADAIENQDWGRQVELDKLLALPDDGGVGPLPEISAGTIDRLVIAARERGGKFMERGNRMRARGAFGRQKQLDAVLDDIDELKPARADYRAKSQAIDVLGDKRQDVFSTDPADYARWHESLPPEAQKANAVAIRQEILDALGKGKATSFGTVDQLATSPYAQENLRRALGPEGDRLLGFVRARIEQVRNASFVDSEANSRTAVLGQDMQNLGNVIREGAGAVVDAKTMNLPNLMVRGTNWLASRGFTEQQAQTIAKMAVDPKQTDRAIQIIAQRLGPDAARQAIEWRKAALMASSATSSSVALSASQ